MWITTKDMFQDYVVRFSKKSVIFAIFRGGGGNLEILLLSQIFSLVL
jgi:hypothetical protein